MRIKITTRIFFILALADLVLLVISSALGTVLVEGSRIFSSPLYLSLWGFSLVLLFLWPVFVKMDKKSFGRFVSNHAAYILLFFLILLSFMTTRRAELTLYGNETFSMNSRLSELGIPWKGDDLEFQYLYGDVEGQQVTTHYNLQGPSDRSSGQISVNNPLRMKQVKFYQQGGGLGFRELTFRVNGKEYDFYELDGEPVPIFGNYQLYFSPDYYKDQTLHYQWKIVDSVQSIIVDQGQYVSGDEPLKTDAFILEILKEDILAVSVLQVVYFPLAIPLSLMALAFLVKLATGLWGRKS